jgi:uncharacterized membrane protein YesL
MGFFSVDGALYKFMQRLWDLFKINIMWLIFSIPIVTLGGATIAAYDVTMKMVDEGEGYVAHQFVASFKKNFKNGILLGLLFLLCIYVVWLDFSLFNQIDGNPMILLIMGIVSAFIFIMAFIYAFPLQARYENTLINTLKNSADIATRYFLRTLSLIFILFVEFVIIFWNTTTMFIGVLIGPACVMLTVSGYAGYFFRQLEKEPGAVKAREPEEENK